MSSKKSSQKKTAKTAAKKPVKKTTPKPAAKKAAKKVSAKSPAKKTAKKSSSKKAAASTPKLVNASSAKCFWVNQGPILKNLVELEVALETMSEEMFSYHVSKDRNDFAEWVEYVLKDFDTAAALRKAKKPATAHKSVVRQLKLYKFPR